MNALKIFTHEAFGSVRAVERDGQPWFVAKDVAERLGYSNPQKAVRDHCKNPCAAGVNESFTLENPASYMLDPQTTLISQSDVLRLIVRSTLPGAERFERWIFEEVLPSILKHGGYLTPDKIEEALLNPDTIIRLATDLKEERAQRQALEARAEADRPKVVFAESIEVARTSILVGEMAKLIKQATGHDIGQNRFFEWLRDRGYLHKSGSQRNMPTQRSIDAEWMEVKEGTRIGSSGECHITRTTKITGRGQIYFVNLFAAQSRAA